MDNTSFWPAFWPNLASTIIGVIVGLPVALWINAKADRAAENARNVEASVLYRRGLVALLAGFSHNQKQLKAQVAALGANKALFDLGLDVVAWEISKDQIIPLLHDPELARRIAFHFASLATQSRLSNLYLDQFAGIAAALGGVEKTRDVLKAHLTVKAALLLIESEALERELRQLLPSEAVALSSRGDR